MDAAHNVVRRFLAFKYQPKESKKSKVTRITKVIRDKTGIGRGVAEDIADAIIRNRDIPRLAIQKKWPVEDGVIKGDKGEMPVSEAKNQITKTALRAGPHTRWLEDHLVRGGSVSPVDPSG
jgi:hypothetical protein